MIQIPDAAIGSIIAAAIAGLVVFISTVLTKEQKTSEFRQVWIDELRKDISHYISGTIEIASLYQHKKQKGDNESKFLDDNFKLIQELQAIEYRILLRLNPAEHSSLISKIKSFRANILAIEQNNQSSRQLEIALVDALTDDCKKILKDEWERVKQGEPTFKIIKLIALMVSACFGIFSIFYFAFSSQTKAQSIPPIIVEKQEVERNADTQHFPLSKTNQTVQVFLNNLEPPPLIKSPGKLNPEKNEIMKSVPQRVSIPKCIMNEK